MEVVLVKEAVDALVVDGIRGCGKLDGELGVGCGLEAWGGRCGAGEKKFRGVQRGEGIEEWEAFVEEETDGDEAGARVALGGGEEIGSGCVEDDGGAGGVSGGEAGGE